MEVCTLSKEYVYVLGFILIVGLAIGVSKIGSTEQASEELDGEAVEIVVPQLNSEEREDSATMVLIGAPPMQPADHIDRWIPEQRHESCLTCHATPETTGAREIPEDHYYDNNINNPIFRDNCIQCHGQQNDTKSAFNSED